MISLFLFLFFVFCISQKVKTGCDNLRDSANQVDVTLTSRVTDGNYMYEPMNLCNVPLTTFFNFQRPKK